MNRLVAVDPGVHLLGVAMFTDGMLEHAGLLQPDKKPAGPESWAAIASMFFFAFRPPMEVVMEFPKVYQGSKQSGDPADMLELAAVDGAIVGAFCAHKLKVTRVFPSDWKGQMDKATAKPRILDRLSTAEKACIEDDGAKTHNTIDAIGIGLHHLGRFERRRVYAR